MIFSRDRIGQSAQVRQLTILLISCLLAVPQVFGQRAGTVLPRLNFVRDDVVRVSWSPDGVEGDNGTGVVVATAEAKVRVRVSERPGRRIFRSRALTVEMDLGSGALTFRDRRTGRLLLAEDGTRPHECERVAEERVRWDERSARAEQTANGLVTVKDVAARDTVGWTSRLGVRFDLPKGEGVYGLGAHMEDYMDLSDKTLWLTQHNLKVTIPMLVSTGGWGVLIDAGCAMKWDCGALTLDAARLLDYYFIGGRDMEDVIARYRLLTGSVAMMPRYVFGYAQSRERYTSSAEIVGTVAEYRRRHVPLDLIVQDWNYWPQGWGYMKMDRRHYPDPRALADSVHAQHCRLMVSIWPNPQYCPQADDMAARGLMLGGSVYDAFSAEGRDCYWHYADREFFSNGFDAWWCDSSEPIDADWNAMPPPTGGRPYSWDDHERRWQLTKAALSASLGATRSSLYGLWHARGIYEHQRAESDFKRVVNLTRSGYAGSQRYATIIWNGDTHASWPSFRQQIPSGLNFMASGLPYWSVDIGSFFTHTDNRWFCRGVWPEGARDDGFKEYYTRMFQWAAFLPVLRSHGTDTPREIWQFGRPGTPYYDAILRALRQRYALLPHIYSMARLQTLGGYSMARALPFDFPGDSTVRDIKDQYMFGPILVCPVTEGGATTRRVYLPQADDAEPAWTDYHTGRTLPAGQWVTADAPLDRLPLYVRGGSILVTGESVEWADAQIGRPLTVTVYPGRDAAFDFYEDSGDGYAYERGESITTPLRWDDSRRTLTIGPRRGHFPAMTETRTLTLRTPWGERTIDYNGKTLKIKW